MKTTNKRLRETSDVLSRYLERLSKAATPAPWMFGPLIEGQAGDYVIWKHRGKREAEFPGPQRKYVGNVGHFIQPVVMACEPDAGTLFDGEKADSELITALRNNLPHIIAVLRDYAAQEKDK